MMAISRTDTIVQRFRDLANEAQTRVISSEQVLRFLNIAQEDLARHGAFRREAAFDATVEVSEYDLSTISIPDDQILDGAVTDLSGGLVGIPCSTHGLEAGDEITIVGTDNYDGDYTLPAQTLGSADAFVIEATYMEETLADPDYVRTLSYPFANMVTAYQLRWHDATDVIPLVSSVERMRRIRLWYSGTGTPAWWHLAGTTITVAPAPSETVTDGFLVWITYMPDEITDTNPPATPRAFDDYYVYKALELFFERDYTGPESGRQAARWGQRALMVARQILSSSRPASSGVRPY